jgi:hypothetical protein
MSRRRRYRKFNRPVVVQPGRIDRDRVVTNVREAALRDWPQPESEKRFAAMQACLAVIKGELPPRVARQAFIDAAKDARIFLGEKA